jgi:hypothetical protein
VAKKDDMSGVKSVPGPKLYGSPSFETGPGRPFRSKEFEGKESYGASPSLETGPKRISSTEGTIGRKAKGSGWQTGTERDQAGEDSGGSATKTDNKVRGK